jgi:hypothetical protein
LSATVIAVEAVPSITPLRVADSLALVVQRST